ncbi:MAG: hypothetical protein PUC98_01420, partial [Clostridiales bacterium]|nr:hypothetical protein [Clostridiales bacterium]
MKKLKNEELFKIYKKTFYGNVTVYSNPEHRFFIFFDYYVNIRSEKRKLLSTKGTQVRSLSQPIGADVSEICF